MSPSVQHLTHLKNTWNNAIGHYRGITVSYRVIPISHISPPSWPYLEPCGPSGGTGGVSTWSN